MQRARFALALLGCLLLNEAAALSLRRGNGKPTKKKQEENQGHLGHLHVVKKAWSSGGKLSAEAATKKAEGLVSRDAMEQWAEGLFAHGKQLALKLHKRKKARTSESPPRRGSGSGSVSVDSGSGGPNMDTGDHAHDGSHREGASEETYDDVFGPDTAGEGAGEANGGDDHYYYYGSDVMGSTGGGDICDHLDSEDFKDERDQVPTKKELKMMVTEKCVCKASEPCYDTDTQEAFDGCYHTVGALCMCMSDEVVDTCYPSDAAHTPAPECLDPQLSPSEMNDCKAVFETCMNGAVYAAESCCGGTESDCIDRSAGTSAPAQGVVPPPDVVTDNSGDVVPAATVSAS